MKPRVLGVLAVLALAACTPAPPTSAPPVTTTTTVTPEVAPETAIREVFDRYVKALHAKDAKAALTLTSSHAVATFEDYRQHALRGTEAQLENELSPGPRSTVYVLRGRVDPELLRSGNGYSIMSFAIEHGLISVNTSSKYVRADGTTVVNQTKPTLENLTIKGDFAFGGVGSDDPKGSRSDRLPLFGFDREGRQWTVNPITMISSSSRGFEELAGQKGISVDQLITEALTAQFGAARAAELRKPIDG